MKDNKHHQGDGAAVPFYVKQTPPELLAPAGDLATAKDVLRAGADAVYFAGNSFGARAYAKNFSFEEVEELVRFAHLRGKTAHLAFNTLIKNQEMEKQVYHALKTYYELGVDAVILQDFGLIGLIRYCFPDFAIHGSTQMNIHSTAGARFMEQQGLTRVITARELSIQEIRRIIQGCHLEVEVFVHGALCVCYSGQCLMSSIIGGRSGNRGRCAQPCRQPYTLLDASGQKIPTEGEYLLSPKDLWGIRQIQALCDAGVSSLKIEGRMKSRDYAVSVVSVYRKYLDQWAANDSSSVSKKDQQILLDAGNRSGFTDLYFTKRNGPGMMASQSPRHKSRVEQSPDIIEKTIDLSGELQASAGDPLTFSLRFRGETIRLEGSRCDKARNRATTSREIEEKLQQTGDSLFTFRGVQVRIQGDVFVPMKAVKAIRRQMLEAVEAKASEKQPRTSPRDMMKLESTGVRRPNIFDRMPVYARVRTKEQFDACLQADSLDYIILPAQNVDWMTDSDKQFVLSLPTVLRHQQQESVSKVICAHPDAFFEADSYDALGFLLEAGVSPDHILGGLRLYALSNRTARAFAKQGIHALALPVELSEKELAHRDNGPDRILVYGRLPLMITANCLQKNTTGCTAKEGMLGLRDRRGMVFPVQVDCASCANILYNSRPLWLGDRMDSIKRLGAGGVEYDFLNESGETAAAVLAGEYVPAEYTRGHFSRGVE